MMSLRWTLSIHYLPPPVLTSYGVTCIHPHEDEFLPSTLTRPQLALTKASVVSVPIFIFTNDCFRPWLVLLALGNFLLSVSYAASELVNGHSPTFFPFCLTVMIFCTTPRGTGALLKQQHAISPGTSRSDTQQTFVLKNAPGDCEKKSCIKS